MTTFTVIAYMSSFSDRGDYLPSAIEISHFDNEEDTITEIECILRDQYRQRNTQCYDWDISLLVDGVPCGEYLGEDGYETYQRLSVEAQKRFLIWRREEFERQASKERAEQALKALLIANETEKRERAMLEHLQKKYSS